MIADPVLDHQGTHEQRRRPEVIDPPTDRLEPADSFNALFTHRVRLRSAGDIDSQLADWLHAAYTNVSVAMRKWLWPIFRDGDKSGVSCGAVIISFVIMPGVRS
jgi:hypothetical protein